MRLPSTAHTSRPWRIHELVPDFRLEDVWALPTPGGPDDFPRLVHQATSGAPEDGASAVGRVLWAVRWKLGALLGWDGEDRAPERPTLRDRLPADLRNGQPGPSFEEKPFTPVYLLEDEFAAEIVNRTVHAIMHLGWVEDEDRGWRGQMGVYVNPNGVLGHAYIAAIKPFRHLLIYPPLMRKIERAWRADVPSAACAGAPA
jgi:Protein of unknown function (DUF2867)